MQRWPPTKSEFLVSPPASFDHGSSGSRDELPQASRLTRRSFIQRGGSATVAALVSLNLAQLANAEVGGLEGCSCSYTWAEGTFLDTIYSQLKTSPFGGVVTAKARLDITPVDGYSDTRVQVTARVECWETASYGATVRWSSPLIFAVNLNGTTPGKKCFDVDFPTIGSYVGAGPGNYTGVQCGYLKVVDVQKACGILSGLVEFSMSELGVGPVGGDLIPIVITAW